MLITEAVQGVYASHFTGRRVDEIPGFVRHFNWC